jgi:hypothetical protein
MSNLPALTKINLDTDGTFTRASIASLYDPSADTMTDVLADARRLLSVPICNPCVATIRTGEGGGSSTLKVVCNDGTYLYAVDGANAKIYRSADGNTWDDLGTLTPAVVATEFTGPAVIHALNNGRILRIVGPEAVTGHFHPWYSDDHGVTWTQGLDGAAAAINFLARPAAWGLGINPTTGTICLATYGSNTTSIILRSVDNGANWAIVVASSVVQTDLGADMFHAIAYHAGTGKWLVNTGDGGDDAFDLISSDDGATWAVWGVAGSYARNHQYTRLLDVGHATKMLAGSDGQGSILWIDMVTGETESILWNWNTTPASNGTTRTYCWLVFKYGGVVYACSWDTAASGSREAVITVSSDLVNWRTYARFANTIVGCYAFAGFANGYLHLAATTTADNAPAGYNTYSHVLLKPASIKTVRGLLLEPAVTNLAISASVSDAGVAATAGQTDNGGSHGVNAADATVKLHGAQSVKTTEVTPTVAHWNSVRWYTAALTAATNYIGRMFVRGRGQGLYASSSQDGCTIINGGQAVPYGKYEVSNNRWRPIFSPIYAGQSMDIQSITATVVSPPTKGTFVVSGDFSQHCKNGNKIVVTGTTGGSDNGTFTVYGNAVYGAPNTTITVTETVAADQAGAAGAAVPNVAVNATVYTNQDIAGAAFGHINADCFQYQALPPSSWQIAGTARAVELYHAHLTLESDWVIAFNVIPQFHSTQAGAADLYIATVWVDATHYVEVFWDVSEAKWTLTPTGTGHGAAVATPATGFQWEQQLTFVIRRSAGMLRLSVHDGAGWQHTAATADHTAGTTGAVILQSGDNALTTTNLFPMLLAEPWVFTDTVVSDTTIEELTGIPVLDDLAGRNRFGVFGDRFAVTKRFS